MSFPAGSDGANRIGAITGDKAVRYLLGARAGQRMTVEMTTTNASAYFNITAPGAIEALHIGSVSGNSFDRILRAGRTYSVDVYLMRNAAHCCEMAVFTIAFQITGTGADGEVQPDFADGLMGGPDYWAVTGLSVGDSLNLRAGPSTKEQVIDQLAEGDVVRNLGCRMAGKQRWCQIKNPCRRRLGVWPISARERGSLTGRQSAWRDLRKGLHHSHPFCDGLLSALFEGDHQIGTPGP